jgi:hypothetical protein
MMVCFCNHCGDLVDPKETKASIRLPENGSTVSGHLCQACAHALGEWFRKAESMPHVKRAKETPEKLKQSGPGGRRGVKAG